MRARSREGKLQVELAQLDYLLPRLQGHGKSLSRLGGGIGTRGPGETKLEMDRRHIRTRMNEIKHQLKTVVDHRERYRNKREQNQVFQIALVGYTNAGKSSWFNVLANEETYERFYFIDFSFSNIIFMVKLLSILSDLSFNIKLASL